MFQRISASFRQPDAGACLLGTGHYTYSVMSEEVILCRRAAPLETLFDQPVTLGVGGSYQDACSPVLDKLAISKHVWGCRKEDEKMGIERYVTSAPACGADFESDGNSAPAIFQAGDTSAPDVRERNYESIRWLCRRGPVPSIYNWDAWLEE